MKNIKITLKLKDNAQPHLFVSQIKELIKNDKSLHKDMKNLLLYLKKSRQGYIPLSTIQEVVIDFNELVNFQRGIEPRISAWVKKEASEEEREEFKTNPKIYLKNVLHLYEAMGYDFYNQEEVDNEFIKKLHEITTQKNKNGKSFLRK